MTPKFKHGFCLLIVAIVVSTYGVYFVAIGTLNYERIQSAARNMGDTRVKAVPFKPPLVSAPRQVRNAWYRGFNATQPVELDRRAGEFFTAPDVARPYLVVVIAAAWISGAFFFVLSGCLRIWFCLPEVKSRRSVAHLLGATSLSVSVVCFCSRFVFSSWMPCHLLNGHQALRDANWSPWAYVQAMINSTRPAAIWALAIGFLCWFSIFSMASALHHASIRDTDLCPAAQLFSRAVAWYALPTVIFYFAISFVLNQIPQASWLIPMNPFL